MAMTPLSLTAPSTPPDHSQGLADPAQFVCTPLEHALVATGAILNIDNNLSERTLYDWPKTGWDMFRIGLPPPQLTDASEASSNEYLDHPAYPPQASVQMVSPMVGAYTSLGEKSCSQNQ